MRHPRPLFAIGTSDPILDLVLGQDGSTLWGPRLVQSAAELLHGSFPDAVEQHPVPEGPHFVYDESPLFLGRRGRGPLTVAWDTALLIDYFEHGRDLWEGQSLPAKVARDYGEQLEALQLVIAMWVLRDIRFMILGRTVVDAKARLSNDRARRRQHAFLEFAEALAVNPPPDDWEPLPPLLLPNSLVTEAIAGVPAGGDRDLVAAAVRRGAHVFLTRDRGILRTAKMLSRIGLVVATPGVLLENLAASGALHCLLAPRFCYWPFPDLDRVAHLVHALGADMPVRAGR